MVARLVRDQEAVGSNPATSTSLNVHNATEHSYIKESSERAAPFLVYPTFPTRYSIFYALSAVENDILR